MVLLGDAVRASVLIRATLAANADEGAVLEDRQIHVWSRRGTHAAAPLAGLFEFAGIVSLSTSQVTTGFSATIGP
jgi:hypothetical protein